MYRLATMHNVTLSVRQTDRHITDRRTDDSMMPIADHAACSTMPKISTERSAAPFTAI